MPAIPFVYGDLHNRQSQPFHARQKIWSIQILYTFFYPPGLSSLVCVLFRKRQTCRNSTSHQIEKVEGFTKPGKYGETIRQKVMEIQTDDKNCGTLFSQHLLATLYLSESA